MRISNLKLSNPRISINSSILPQNIPIHYQANIKSTHLFINILPLKHSQVVHFFFPQIYAIQLFQTIEYQIISLSFSQRPKK